MSFLRQKYKKSKSKSTGKCRELYLYRSEAALISLSLLFSLKITIVSDNIYECRYSDTWFNIRIG